jgi:hypothetical protein
MVVYGGALTASLCSSVKIHGMPVVRQIRVYEDEILEVDWLQRDGRKLTQQLKFPLRMANAARRVPQTVRDGERELEPAATD